jgi:8-oxo-dGTP diphosphatase
MKRTTLCYLLKDGEVLLAMKKRGFGEGKWNGIGGKLKAGEGFEDAAIRELWEEINVRVTPEDLEPIGVIEFDYRDNPDWHQHSHVFVIRKWQGEPAESEEMRPQWYPIDALPFESMWIDDPHWLPKMLSMARAGTSEKMQIKFVFNDNGEELIESHVTLI